MDYGGRKWSGGKQPYQRIFFEFSDEPLSQPAGGGGGSSSGGGADLAQVAFLQVRWQAGRFDVQMMVVFSICTAAVELVAHGTCSELSPWQSLVPTTCPSISSLRRASCATRTAACRPWPPSWWKLRTRRPSCRRTWGWLAARALHY